MAETPKTITIDVRAIPRVREALAAAWDEGVADGRWNEEHEYQIMMGTRVEIVNPYRHASAANTPDSCEVASGGDETSSSGVGKGGHVYEPHTGVHR